MRRESEDRLSLDVRLQNLSQWRHQPTIRRCVPDRCSETGTIQIDRGYEKRVHRAAQTYQFHAVITNNLIVPGERFELPIPGASIHDAPATYKDQRKAFTHRFVKETCAANCCDSRFHCFETAGFLGEGHQRTRFSM